MMCFYNCFIFILGPALNIYILAHLLWYKSCIHLICKNIIKICLGYFVFTSNNDKSKRSSVNLLPGSPQDAHSKNGYFSWCFPESSKNISTATRRLV